MNTKSPVEGLFERDLRNKVPLGLMMFIDDTRSGARVAH